MKKINLILGALVGLFAFSACTEEVEYTPAAPEDALGVYFEEPNSTLQLAIGQTSFDVEVCRVDTTADQDVAISVESDDEAGVLSIPSQVSFKAGEATAKLVVTCDLSKKSPSTLNMQLSIDGASNYDKATKIITVKLPEWLPLGNAVYVEDLVTGFFSVKNVAYYVEIQQHLENPGRYRLVNPYGAAYPYNEPGDYDTSKDYYMLIDATDPEGVVMPMFYSGMDWGYGEFGFISMASYYIDMKGYPFETVKAAGYCGTFKDGIITFPADAMLGGMANYNDFGLYQTNASGNFMIFMPGVYESMTASTNAVKSLSFKNAPSMSKGSLNENVVPFAK